MPAPIALPSNPQPQLVRGMSLRSAVAVNMIDMIGVGPFITLPLIVTAMGGPQAMLGWILGAVFAMCDGMIWAEFGAAFPGAGGSYRYLSEAFGRHKWGRFFSFLFVWQLSFSAPLSIASGCIGLAMYATYFFPGLSHPWLTSSGHFALPGLGDMTLGFSVSGMTMVAVGTCLLALWLAYRKIGNAGKLSQYLWVVVLATVAWIIVASLMHFDPRLAFDFPAHAFTPSKSFLLGLGSAMLIATYDYWGYYNVGFLGGEVARPERNIPRAILISIALVATLYILMNIGVLGVLPWRTMDSGATLNSVISVMMEQIYGSWAGKLVTVLIMWTAFASVFSLLLGYSRAPYAAAVDGNYFKSFAKLHPRGHFPHVSMLWLGGVAALCCFFSLIEVIAALVVIRITLQFLLQAIGLIVLRVRRPDLQRPFKMWWYPIPAILAIVGFIYVLLARTDSLVQLRYALVLLVIGVILYIVREFLSARRRRLGRGGDRNE
jgi:amino acid transporter